MSEKTIKLYSHNGTLVKVAEFYKSDLPEIGWRTGWFESYEDAKEDLEFQRKVKYLIPENYELKKRINQLEKDVTMVRIKELESEISGSSNTSLKSIFNTLIGSFIGYILAIITLALVN